MKTLIKPFLAWLKKAIDLDINLDLEDGRVLLLVSITLAGMPLFTETWTWAVPDQAVEAGPTELEDTPTEADDTPATRAAKLRRRAAPAAKGGKLRWAPHRIPTLRTLDANVSRRVAR